MIRTRLWSLLLIPVAVVLMGAAVLVDPPPINVPAGLSVKDVSKAIRAGIVQRGWVVLKDEKGVIDAQLNVRTHEVRVAIPYDTKQVKITYVSSQNLDYDEKGGTRHIHKKYNQWIDNMVQDIQRQLQVAAIGHE
jgi:hypothetical protein